MAWPEDDKAKRVSVAKELDRQTFWKEVYVAAIVLGQASVNAERMADVALHYFDMKFKGNPS